MEKSWEEMNEKIHEIIGWVEPEDFPPDLAAFYKLWYEIRNLYRSNMGIPSDEYEKVLRQAEKMMEPYDPDKTFYLEELAGLHAENVAECFYKANPDSHILVD